MISNMQHQQFDSVVMDKILPSPQAVVVDKYVNNNNNNNMNKNIHIMTSADLITTADQNPDVIIFDPSVDYVDNNSSSDTKETIIIAASQSLYENAPLIRALPITTATSNPTTTIIMTNTNQNFGCGTSGKSQSPGKTGLAEKKIKEEHVEKDIHNHEYALISAKCDQQNELLRSQDRTTSIKSNYNNQREIPRSHYVRQQSRTDALRCMDIHNYSKINRFDDSTNSSSPEDDDDDDDDDLDDDYDDDVFGTTNATSKLSSSNPHTIMGHLANKGCDSSANKSNPQRKQSQSNINQNIHHIENAALGGATSPPTKSPIKGGATASSTSTSPTININSPTGVANCNEGHDDMENGENSGGMSGDKLAPDHHARRPMNAFLIFCKRHRAIVREKYKNLENRQITKILGEWWATLSNTEKACYTDLAKQYKDAFFKANPNFKWYKLPAPPLRTCSMRPGHQSPTSPLTGNNYYMNDNYNTSNMNGIHDDEIDRFNCDNGFVRKSSTSINNTSDNIYSDNINNRNNNNNSGSNNSSSNILHMRNSAVGVFKLADEAQMGGLSSLMSSGSNNGSSSSSNSPIGNGSGTGQNDNAAGNNNPNDNNYRSRIDPRHDALQNALSETSNFLSSTMPSCRNDMEPFQHMRNHAIHMESNQMLNGKRKASDSSLDWNAKKKLLVSTEFNEYDMGPKKASRSCKGKRYKELMISGQIISSGKKGNQKVRTPTSSGTYNGYYKTFENPTEMGNHHSNISEHNILPRAIKTEKFESIIPDQLDNTCQYGIQPQPESPNSQKQFDASDFDLEEKIKALPAQCLESYLIRKRETKKKKKIGSKRRVPSSSSSSQAHKPQMIERQLIQNNKQTNRPDQHQSPPKTIQEARERMQCGMVGSQKRKARKESITRRDVNTILSSVELLSPATNTLFEAVGLVNKMTENGGVEIKVECDLEPCYNEDQRVGGMMIMEKKMGSEFGSATTTRANGAPTSDLLILAEVATNHIAGEVNN